MSSLGPLGDPKIIENWTRGDQKCAPNRKTCRFLRGCFFGDFLDVKKSLKKQKKKCFKKKLSQNDLFNKNKKN